MPEIGGFSFRIGLDVSAAQQGLQRLIQASQQAAQQVQANLSRSSVNVDTRAAEQAFARIRQVREQATGAATITVRAEATEATASLDRLAGRAREIGGSRINLTVRADGSQQAEQAIERVSQGLRAVRAGERVNISVRADGADQADSAIRRLTTDINTAKAAGARVAVNVQTTGAQPSSFFQQAQGGFVQQITPGLATGVAASAGVFAAQAVRGFTDAVQESFAAGIRYNAMLETSSAQFRVFTGSAGAAEESLKRLRANADITPFDTAEVVRSGQVFAQVSGGEIARMERLVELAEQLATINPRREEGGGLEGATFAIREALGGDFTSAQRRFNISRADIQSLKDAGLSGVDLAEALVKAAGGSDELVKAMGSTFEGRLSTAKATIDNLRAAATQPIFEVLSLGLEKFNTSTQQSMPTLQRMAELLGRIGPGLAVGSLLPAGPGGVVGTAINAALTRGPAEPAPGGLSPAEQAQQERAAVANAAVDEANRKLAEQKKALEEIDKQLDANAQRARVITEEYERQLRPLESQRRALQGQIDQNSARGREIDARARAAQGPVEVRAEVASTDVVLSHEQALMEIRHRRAELAEQISAAEEAAAQHAAEAQIRSAETALRAAQDTAREQQQARQDALEGLRDQVQTQQQARQDALDGLREEVRGRQEARQTALDGLRELISAQQEQRRDALEGIQEEIRARREQYDDAREVSRDLTRNAQEQFQDSEREEDRAHTTRMDHLRDQIEAIQEQTRARRGQTDAERELAAFDASERERSRQERLSDAQRAISTARTGTELRAAALAFRRTSVDVAADRHREELQNRIKSEQDAEDKKREQAQDRVNALQKKARDEDRAYQQDKQRREDQFREEDRGQRDQDREDELAERQRRRAEDDRVREQQRQDRDQAKQDQATLRAAEQAARDQDRADQAAIRAQEKADRDQDRADQKQIRDQERADREADRAADRALRDQERGIQAARDALAAGAASSEQARDDARLGRLREAAGLEDQILANRQKGLDAVDVRQAAQAAADKVRNDDEKAALADQKAALDDQIAAINRNKEAEQAALDAQKAALEIAKGHAKEIQDALEKAADAAAKVARGIAAGIDPATGGIIGGNIGPTNPDTGTTFTGQAPAAPAPSAASEGSGWNDFWKSITDGLGNWLSGAGSLTDVFTTWAADQIAALAAAWETASPSQVTYRLGGEIGQGLVDGITGSQQAISDAFAATVQAAWDEGSAIVDSVISEIALRFGGSDAIDLPAQLKAQAPAVGQAISDVFNQGWAQGGAAGVDAVLDQIGEHFATVGDQIDSQQNERAVEQAIEDLFGVNVLDRAFRNVDRNMEIYGNNAAVAWIDGWTAMMQSWNPYVPAPTGGGGGGINAQGGVGTTAYGPTSTTTTSMGYPILPGTQDITSYLVGKGYVQGTDDFHRLFEQLVSDMYDRGLSPPPDMVVTGRRFGGDYQPDKAYLLHKDEIMVPNTAGQVLPPEFLAGVKAMAASGGGAIAAASAGGAPQVHFNFNDGAFRVTSSGQWGGIDRTMLETRLARHGNEIMDDLVDILHASQRHAPVRSDRDLGGAR